MDTNVRDDREAVSIREACRISDLGRSTIYGLIREGRLETVKIGRRRLVTRPSLAALFRRPAAR